jgi:beta-lactamase class A
MSEEAKQELLSIVRRFGDIGLYARDVDGNKTIALNEHELFITCSCYKVITAIALYKTLEATGMCDSDTLQFRVEDRVGGSGILKAMQPHPHTIFNYLFLMLHSSDNTATNIIEQYVGLKRQQEVIARLGLEKTKIRLNIKEACYGRKEYAELWTPEDCDKDIIATNAEPDEKSIASNLSESNVSTPFELCQVLEELLHPKIITPDSARKILKVMMHYDPDDRIIELGRYIEIANKSGWMTGVRADINLVFSDNPFYLVVMAKNLENHERNDLVAAYNDIINHAIDYFDE